MGEALHSRFGQRFNVLRKLGEGAMGVVYEAHDRHTDRRVALKVLRSFDHAARSRFKREFRAISDILHPNLVRLYELFERDEYLFFTMDLVEGVDFVTHVRGAAGLSVVEQPTLEYREGWLSNVAPPLEHADARMFDEGRLRHALAGLVRGVATLHASGMLHRDIKPSNVLVDAAEGAARLLDFGLVLAPGQFASTAEHVVGTAHYMSPEQAGAEALSSASDWYSVGVVLFEALTGCLPFPGGALDVMVNKRTFDAPAPSALAAYVPADLDALCVGLLRRNPAARPDAANLLRLLPPSESQDRTRSAGRLSQRAPRAFFGRELEQRWLHERFYEARGQAPVAAFVRGESGLGKTELVARFIARQREQQPQLVALCGRCYERESVHYKGIDGVVDSLRAFLQALPHEQTLALVPRHADVLVQQFPALARVPALAQAGTSHVRDAHEGRSLASEALRELLQRLADRSPVIVSVDDLQWIDPDGWTVLKVLLRGLDGPQLLFVGIVTTLGEVGSSVRPSELSCRQVSLELGPLSLEDTRALAQDYALHEGLDGGDLARMAEEAQGHPIFLYELIRHAVAQPEALRPAPLRLEEALWNRVVGLAQDERNLVELAAVVGAPVPLTVAAAALELPVQRLRESLVRLRTERLSLTAGALESESLQLWHERVRRAVLVRLSDDRAVHWHRRMATTMARLRPHDSEALALHWSRALEPARAAHYAILAGDAAVDSFAFDHAASLYRFALEHTQDAPDRQRVSLALGQALADAGRGQEAARVLLAAAAPLPAPHSLELRHRAAHQLLRSGYIDEGLDVLREVLAAVGMSLSRTPRAALASLLYARMRLKLRGLRHDIHPASAVDAALLKQIDICWSMASGLALVDMVRSADFHTRSLLLALEAGEPVRLSRALALEAAVTSAEGNSGRNRVAGLFHLAEQVASHGDEPIQSLTWLAVARASVALQEGRFEDCLRQSSDAEALLKDRAPGSAWELASVRAFSIWTLAYMGRLRELSDRLPAMQRDCEERGDRFGSMNLVLGPVYLHYLARDAPAAMRGAGEQLLKNWSHGGFHLQHLTALFSFTSADLYERKWEEARQRVETTWPLLEGSLLLRVQVHRIDSWWLRGRVWLAAAERQRSRTLRILRTSIKHIETEDMTWSKGHALALRAALAWLEADLAEADRLLYAAAEAYDVARMDVHAAGCRVSRVHTAGGRADDDVLRGTRVLREQGVSAPERLAGMLWPVPEGSPRFESR